MLPPSNEAIMEDENNKPDDEQKESASDEAPPPDQSESLNKEMKTSKTTSKTSSGPSFNSTTAIKSFSMKTSGSKSTMLNGSLIPTFSAINNVKMVYKSTEELDNQAERRPEGRPANDEGGPGGSGFGGFSNFPCATMFNKRSPFIHNPPQPEIRRARIDHPRSPKDYIINLREDLADFQESHGLPRTRDYSFLSLGLALVQETARTVCSLFLMFAELFPILAVISLILRFALDKIIEILETPEPVPKLKKAVIFGLQLLVILIPLWILIGTIVIPLITLILSIFQRMLRIKGGKKAATAKSKPKTKTNCCKFF